MEGWIKIYRKLTEWEWYQDSKMVHLLIHLIFKANYETKKWMGVEIKRGQLVTGRKQLSKETGISEQSIRTALNKLKSTSEITIKSTNKYSLITVCNFDSYQQVPESYNHQTNQQLTINQPSTNHQLTTTKNIKNYKEVEEERGARAEIPSLNDVIKYAQGPQVLADKECCEAYYDNREAIKWIKNAGEIRDWKADFRGWVRNWKQNENNGKTSGGVNPENYF